MTRTDWEINIENLADSVAEKCGEKVALSAFQRAGATCFEDLNPAHYEEVFGDLMLIDSED